MRRTILAILAVLFTTSAHAQIIEGEVCPGFSGVEIIENIECVQAELGKADADLNATWKKAIANHPSGAAREIHTEDIRKSQRAWIAFRDLDCEAASKTGIAKYWELNKMYCLLAHTRLRTKALKELYTY